MKKIATVLLGAVMALGTVSLSFAGGGAGDDEQQDQGGGQTQDGAKQGKKGGKGERGKGKRGKGKRNKNGAAQTPTTPATPQP